MSEWLQGREKDVAIFSTVRTQVGRSIGFVADERRMNVGLTRARSSLIVIGNAKALRGDERWGNLIKQATVDRSASGGPICCWYWLYHSVTCCSVLCCALLCCAVLCCAVLCCAVLCCAVLCCAVLRCAALGCAALCCAALCSAEAVCWC